MQQSITYVFFYTGALLITNPGTAPTVAGDLKGLRQGSSMVMVVSAIALLGSAFLVPSSQPAVPAYRARVSTAPSMVMPLPAGSLVALVTPMKDDGSVDIPGLRSLLQWHKEEGTDGVVILGTTGEASTLTDEEKGEVMAAAREEIGGKLPIVVGTGTISTSGTIAATKQAKLFGADAALIVTPYYVKPSQAGLVSHFTAIADASELPIILYNVPGRTGVDLSVETTIALSRHPMICGLKDATGDNTRVGPMRAVCGDDFRLYSGEDAMARDYVVQGGDGVISVTANVAPATVARVMAAANAGDVAASKTADSRLEALHRDLFCEANPIPVKWALHRAGRAPAGIRSPLAPLGLDYHSRVESALKQAGCFASDDDDCDATEEKAGSYGWPARNLLLQGHLFDQGLINQALEIIEKRGGDFEITAFSVQPNDQNSEFNFKRTSSVALKVRSAARSADLQQPACCLSPGWGEPLPPLPLSLRWIPPSAGSRPAPPLASSAGDGRRRRGARRHHGAVGAARRRPRERRGQPHDHPRQGADGCIDAYNAYWSGGSEVCLQPIFVKAAGGASCRSMKKRSRLATLTKPLRRR